VDQQQTQNPDHEPPQNEKENIEPKKLDKIKSRRNFFKKAALGVFSLGAASAADSVVESERGNESVVEGEKGIHNILYCRHDLSLKANAMDEADYLILELCDFDYSSCKDDIDIKQMIENLPSYKPYRNLVLAAATQHKPIFFVDSSTNLETLTGVSTWAGLTAVGAAETFVGTEALKFALHPENHTSTPAARAISRKLLPKGSEDKSIQGQTRRGMLRAGTGAIGAYFLTPALQVSSTILRSISGKNPDNAAPSTKASKALTQFNAVAHPELDSAGFEGRNALIAQKAESIAAMLTPTIGKKPRSCIAIGSAHMEIERELQLPESERIKRMASIFGEDKMGGEQYILRVDPSLIPENDRKIDCKLSLVKDPAIAQHHKSL